MLYAEAVFPLRLWCVRMCPKISGFGMLNNGKVKNESACAQQTCWFAEKNQLNGNRAQRCKV